MGNGQAIHINRRQLIQAFINPFNSPVSCHLFMHTWLAMNQHNSFFLFQFKHQLKSETDFISMGFTIHSIFMFGRRHEWN